MAILSVKRMRRNRNSSQDLKTMRAQTCYQVITDDPATSEIQIRRAPGMPRVGDPHPDDLRLTVVNIETGDPDDSGVAWNDVKVKYEALVNGAAEETVTSPLDLPAEVSWGGRKTQEPIDMDILNNPIVNTVGEPFDPPIVETFTDQEITITKNLATWDPVAMQTYFNAVNQDAFLGFRPGTVLMDELKAKRIVTPTLVYWAATFVMLVRVAPPDGAPPEMSWARRIKNEGFYCSDGGTPTPKIIRALDASNKPVVLPVPLKADGTRVLVTPGPIPTFSGGIFYINFPTKKPLPFAALNIL